jgi:hypothetical protein
VRAVLLVLVLGAAAACSAGGPAPAAAAGGVTAADVQRTIDSDLPRTNTFQPGQGS